MTNEEKWKDKVEKILRMAEDPAVDEKARQNYMDRATEIMVKYGIEAAVLDFTDHKTVTATKIIITMKNPYQLKKKLLLNRVAQAFNCLVVNSREVTHVYGTPDDLDRTKTLYNSLLVQLFIGLSNAQDSKPSYIHGKAYNSSWVNGFVITVTERVQNAVNRVKEDVASTGTGMELALVDLEKVISAARSADFPELSKGRALSYNSTAAGYAAGRAAANRADLGQTRLGSRRALGT